MEKRPVWANPEGGEENHADVTNVLCPECGSGWLRVTGQVFNRETPVGEAFRCDECGHHFDDKGHSLEN